MTRGCRLLLSHACWMLPVAAGCQDGGPFDRWGADRQSGSNRTARSSTAGEPPGRRGGHTVAEPVADPSADDASAEPVNVLQINEDSITVEEILRPLRSDFVAQMNSTPPERYREYVVDALQKQIRTQARNVLLHQEASRRLTDQEAEMIDKFTDQRIRNIVQEEHGGRHTRWEQAVAEQGLSTEEAREQVRRDLVVMRYLQSTITPRIQAPTRRELVRYFEQRRAEWITPQRREMFLIQIDKGDDADAARLNAERLLAQLGTGADFAELAREHSDGIRAADGGAWGVIGRDSLRAQWAVAAETLFQLPPGGTSGVVDADTCFFIVRVGRIEAGSEPSFTEVQRRLTEAYREHQFNTLVDELVLRLHEQAVIRPADLSLFLRAVIVQCPMPDGQPLLSPR
ncbi:MAG TPA: peptidyl-prolyl cis-trans isomerase [Phycisphaerae bacterium]|nr:peptidyl-prolyl cis-trans isomerase [Phycisphaerae bacterium]